MNVQAPETLRAPTGIILGIIASIVGFWLPLTLVYLAFFQESCR